ncbi:PIR Superfamily Protein [Plasmodium ovale wallikeri]|uniref:PIR Superfamily Protein n=1 Tax=Plasmodium ovale wallikeri TaxID=864142 RepID=A0A1A9AAZ5_PLAOA|nr:PIR Superfamily Protein [Plasmodium ovale wallikeri]SBT57662.1 PIR Superfamily Protein [Plasmodium ovale wallikeri]
MASEHIPVDNYYTHVNLFDQYSEKFNEVIGDASEDTSYQSKCDDMQRSLFKSDSVSKERCQNILKYVNYISKQQSDEEKKKLCAHLNYLLNCDASSDTIPNDYKPNIINAYLRLFSSYNNVCYLSIDFIEADELKKLKDMHNMHKLLKNIKSKVTSCTGDCCSNAKQCAETYESYIHNCYIGSTDHFCVELAKIKAAYEENMKTAIKTCTDAREMLTPPMQNNSGVSILIPCTILLVIPCFLFILYKFTPFSSWIIPQIQKIKRIINNTDEQNENLILDNFDLMQYPQEKGPYNIAYNSSKNS